MTENDVVDAVLGHPVFQIMHVEADQDGQFVHLLRGEEQAVYVEREVIAPEPVASRWENERWKDADASSFIFERYGENGDDWRIRSPFWDFTMECRP